MLRTLAILISLLPSIASAQFVQVQQNQRLMQEGCGSGTLICLYKNNPGWGQVLTCAHCVPHRNSRDILVTYLPLKKNPEFMTVQAKLIAFDAANDLALLDCQISDVPELSLADESPEIGTKVRIVGYGENKFAVRETEITGRIYAPMRGSRVVRIPDCLHCKDRGRQGDSGCPWISDDNKLVGVHSMSSGDDKTGIAIPVERVRKFLKEKGGWK